MLTSPDSSLRQAVDNSPRSNVVPRRTVNKWLGALMAAPLVGDKLWFPLVEAPRSLSLAELAGTRIYEIGMTVGAGEPWEEPEYDETVSKYATVVAPVSEFSQQTVDMWGASIAVPFIQRAASNRQTFRMQGIFENGDYGQELQNIMSNTSPDQLSFEVRGFMQRRTRGVLQTVKDALAEIHMQPADLELEIVFADSALWFAEDEKIGGWAPTPYTKASPDGNWIRDAWIFTDAAIRELGFREDTTLIYRDYGIEVPCEKGYFVRDILKGVKEQIGLSLGIEPNEVEMEVGLSGHFKDNTVPDAYSADISQVSTPELRQYLSDMAEVGPTHYDHFLYQGSYSGMQNTVNTIAATQLSLGPSVSKGITFVNALRRSGKSNVDTLIDPNTYQPLPLTQDLINLLS